MNKKGFTLVELLAVIVILSLLALLTGTAVTKMVKDSKENLSEIQIESIESAAKAWGADNIDLLPEAGSCIYLTLQDLKDYGLLDGSIIDANTSREISNSLKIKISTESSAKGNPIVSYEVDPDSITECTAAY